MGALKPEALVAGLTGGFFVSAGPALADDTPTTAGAARTIVQSPRAHAKPIQRPGTRLYFIE
ncbi:hypothetical protein RSM1_05270 [Methylobacterium radiotolerans]|nr:hypothetical protein RSM1_05270 [Methylobacterium radiotolerans]